MASQLTIQTNSAITAVKDDLTVMHAVSTANVAAVAQTVAVHAALISPAAPAPPPITLIPVPTVVSTPVEPLKSSPHLVD